MKIAALQMSATANPTTNPDRIIAAMARAKEQQADLLVAPELAMTGYGRGEELIKLAEPADGPTVQKLTRAAQDIGISLVVGFPEREGDTLYISAMIIDGAGGATQIYRKAFLYGSYEKGIFTANGPSCFVVDLCGLKAGFLICYDVEFPENVRRLAKAGADIVIVPTALPHGEEGRHIAQKVIPVRAFENQVHVVYANHADKDLMFEYQGLSSIAAPNGKTLAAAPESGEALLFAEITPDVYLPCRERNPYISDLELAERNQKAE
ncbi:carbon-nitrogen hydrolase family protein [Rhodobacteraceae bacterium B1Z28]|uniref:Carbon-nitrogen hydrolase family protein n=1 Tax=Ruegeria haliotis TaxID=2747601 RepID=A0ABX2PM19_9RHOB|nr:carbon-nitrogen hydrolase family protein [Ruegeria haliotis]NVO54332.1 carbon-nitrogen hydrolase family protein [Ruegeria haliotis]